MRILRTLRREISADAPAVSPDVVTTAESRDFTLSKPSDVYWRIKEVKLRGSDETDYMLETSIIRTHSVDLAGMDTSFDENVDMESLYATFTPDTVLDSAVVVNVSSVPYVTKKGVYEVYVQTSTGKVSSGEGEDDAVEVWTDEAPLIFEVTGSGQSTTGGGTGAPSSSGGGCDSGLSAAGLMTGLLLLVKRRRH